MAVLTSNLSVYVFNADHYSQLGIWSVFKIKNLYPALKQTRDCCIQSCDSATASQWWTILAMFIY